ncbi:hypothetical protein ILYODFUR_035661 [Ilyodon furcidens]|uniref:Secreted protein n=1 Tax=Ilyodon furcidens TaxID=33524 RepID=A0ABV0UCV1_9TELE
MHPKCTYYLSLFIFYFNAASKGDSVLCSVFAKGRIRKGIRCKTCAKHTTEVKNMISILGCSRTGLTTTTTGTGDRQGNCGNWATVGQQRREDMSVGREEDRQEPRNESRNFECWDCDRKS